MPLLNNITQRKHKDVSSDAPSKADLMAHQMKTFFWKIMVVVVFGLSLRLTSPQISFSHLKGRINFRHACVLFFLGQYSWEFGEGVDSARGVAPRVVSVAMFVQ